MEREEREAGVDRMSCGGMKGERESDKISNTSEKEHRDEE